MKTKTSNLAIAAGAVLMAANVAQAHPGHIGHGGFGGGFGHPYSGIDHMLAMIAVGLLAVQMGGRAVWFLPLTFVGLMIGGGLLNFAGLPVPFVEQGIMASVLVLGLMIAMAAKMPIAIPVTLVGLFAIFHGYAHVAEMHVGMAPMNYALGFILATASLHAIGIGVGLAARQTASGQLVRLGGAAIAACGLLLCLGLIHA